MRFRESHTGRAVSLRASDRFKVTGEVDGRTEFVGLKTEAVRGNFVHLFARLSNVAEAPIYKREI